MISLDTNVVLAAFDPEDALHQKALDLLARVRAEALAICPVVYAELAASVVWEGLRAFLDRAEVAVIWPMPDEVWRLGGEAFGRYARARRREARPRRIVADFLIGAHAQHHGLSLCTLDPAAYRASFPGLALVHP